MCLGEKTGKRAGPLESPYWGPGTGTKTTKKKNTPPKTRKNKQTEKHQKKKKTKHP